MPSFFLSFEENLSLFVSEILVNKESKSSDEVHRQLSERASEFIQFSREGALRYAGNRVLWNKQPLFHAVLFEQLARQEVNGTQREKFYCHTVYCYAQAGDFLRATQCAEQSIKEGFTRYFLVQVENKDNQSQLPIFCAIFYAARAKHLEKEEINSEQYIASIESYKRATYFYALARQITQARQCAKVWAALTEKMDFLFAEASNVLNNQKNPLYCAIIYHEMINDFLNSPDYGTSLDEDSMRVISYYSYALRCYSRAGQIDSLRSLACAFKFIDNYGHFLYTDLLFDYRTQQENPLLIAVFHEVYNHFGLAAQQFRLAGYSADASRCLEREAELSSSDLLANGSLRAH